MLYISLRLIYLLTYLNDLSRVTLLCFRSVGIFVESELPWELRLVRSAVISTDNFIETPDFVRFFHVLAGHVLDPADGGHVDFFLPLGSCGN